MNTNSTDTLIQINRDTFEQSNQNALAPFFNARMPGYNLYLNNDLGAGSQLNLTDYDDTVTITGNLIAGTSEVNGTVNYSTAIDLKGGDDVLTIQGGKILGASEENVSSIFIQGGDGDKTFNFTNGLENNSQSLNLTIQGKGNHIANITGDLISGGQVIGNGMNFINFNNNNSSDVALSNDINISGNLIAQNGGRNSFHEAGNSFGDTYSTFHISGDVIASGGSNDFAQTSSNSSLIVDGSFITENGGYSQINHLSGFDNYILSVGGDIYNNNNGRFNAYFSSLKTNFTVGSIISDNQSNAMITASSNYFGGDAVNSIVVNGNIEALNASSNTIVTFANSSDGEVISTFDVYGDVIASGYVVETTNYGEYTRASSNVINVNGESTLTFLGGFTADAGGNIVTLSDGNDDIYIEGDLHAANAIANAYNSGINSFALGAGDDIFTLMGDVTASNGGRNTIDGGAGDDTIQLSGHIDAGALTVLGGDGNDTLILSATTQARFEANFKEWLVDLADTGSLADSGIETIRLDVRTLQTAKLGWLTDLIDQANADGAHITLEDRNGNVLVEPQLYLSQDNASEAQEITTLLDEYAPAADASKIAHDGEASTAFQPVSHEVPVANNNYFQDFEQYATAAIVA